MLMTMHIVKGMLAFQKVPSGEGTVALPSSHTCDAAWMKGGPATVSTPSSLLMRLGKQPQMFQVLASYCASRRPKPCSMPLAMSWLSPKLLRTFAR